MNCIQKFAVAAIGFGVTIGAGAGVTLAGPAASGKIIEGSTFGTDDAFHFTNDSTGGIKITQLTWDLTPVNAFFDTTDADPGLSPSALSVSSLSDTVGHTFPTDASQDGKKTLTIDFSNFDAGETFIFGVDTDLFNNIDGSGVNGDQFLGATVKAIFSDGSSRFGTYVATDETGFGSQVFITSTVPPTSAVPLPPALYPAAAMMATMAGVGFVRRRRAAAC